MGINIRKLSQAIGLMAFMGSLSLAMPAHAIEVTNESWCLACDSYDPTLPARPKSGADYAGELGQWMGKLPGGTSSEASRLIAQSLLDSYAQPLYKDGANEIFNAGASGWVHNPRETVKGTVWDIVVADYLQKAVVQFDKAFHGGSLTFRDAFASANRIQQKFGDISKDAGGVAPGPREPLRTAIFGYGGTTYGDLFRSEGVMESRLEGLLIDGGGLVADYFAGEVKTLLPQAPAPTDIVKISDYFNGFATILKGSNDAATRDFGFALGILTTAAAGVASGGAALLIAPAQIYADTIDKISQSLDDAALETHFAARYYLATRAPEIIDAITLPSGAMDLYYGIPAHLNTGDPLAARIANAANGFGGRREICKTEGEQNCLNAGKLKSAYILADFLAVAYRLNIERIKANFAGYVLTEHLRYNTFPLGISPGKAGEVFQVAIPSLMRSREDNVIAYTSWNWSGRPGVRPTGFSGGADVASGSLDFKTDSLLPPTPGGSESLSVWVQYGGSKLPRFGAVTLTYSPAVAEVPSNTAPVLSNEAVALYANQTTGIQIRPNFTDDGERAKAFVKVRTNPSCGTIRFAMSSDRVIYTPNASHGCAADQFKWIVVDDRGLESNEATVSLTFLAPSSSNTAPVAQAMTIGVELGRSVTFTLLASDAETPANQLGYTISAPVNGTLKPTGLLPGQYVYTHTGTGPESLSYTVSDGSLGATGSLTITVRPPADRLPYARAQTLSLSPGKSASIVLDGGDGDAADQANLEWSIVGQPLKGTAAISGNRLSYTHTAADAQPDSVQWQVRDKVKNVAARATLNVAVLNRAPVITGITNYPATSGTPISVNLNAVDPDGNAVQWLLAAGSPGQIAGNTWTHTFTQTGTYLVTVLAGDGYASTQARTSFTVVVDGACNFVDVGPAYYYYTQICTAAAKQWVVGYTSGDQLYFYPNRGITRAEFAKLVFKYLEESNGLAIKAATPSFPDVPATHGMFPYIQTLRDMGLVNGYADGTYKPDQILTRAEMVLILHRLTGWGNSGVDTRFRDVPLEPPPGMSPDTWLPIYFAAGQMANHLKILRQELCRDDFSQSCFKPNEDMRRDEALVVLEQLANATRERSLRISASSDLLGTWTDPNTGLTWARCAMGQTWNGADCSGSGELVNLATTHQKVAGFSLAGFTDWRLPTLRELHSLVDYQEFCPATNPYVFPSMTDACSTSGSNFWSSTSAGISGQQGIVMFADGSITGRPVDWTGQIRPVRGSTPPQLADDRPNGDYVAHDDGTVTHKPTGLMWKRCHEGETWRNGRCEGLPGSFDTAQLDALDRIFAGHADWRLPTIEELFSLVDLTTKNINGSIFPSGSQAWKASTTKRNAGLIGAGQRWLLSGMNTLTNNGGALGALMVRNLASGEVLKPASTTSTTTTTSTTSSTPTTTVATTTTTTVAPRPAYTDNGDGTVTDPATGLSWMRCAMGQVWTGSTCSGSAGSYNWDQARAMTTAFAGHGDWRLPNVRELLTLVDWTVAAPAIDALAFPGMPARANFWSSTGPGATGGPWDVFFGGNGIEGGGVDNFNQKTDGSHVRLVRGQTTALLTEARPASDYRDNGDGTITHLPTGLIWQRCAVGQTWTGTGCSGSPTTHTYSQAASLTSTMARVSDWRLPTASELLSLVDFSHGAPYLNATVFPDTSASAWVWTATPSSSEPTLYRRAVNFSNAMVASYFMAAGDSQVRLVRTPASAVTDIPLSYPLQLEQGWNLLGNSIGNKITVAYVFGYLIGDSVTSVWKWDAATSGWQFYTPSLDASALQSYAAGKGYGVLREILPGEGYWVNAKSRVSPGTQSGMAFWLSGSSLASGWNLVATGVDDTPNAFGKTFGNKSLTTLWAWDNPRSQWYFYAPALENQGGTVLKDYTVTKGYLDFATASKTLAPGGGFWVNKSK